MKAQPEVIHTDTAPEAIGPYSQGIALGDWVFVSGQIPLDPATGELVRGNFSDHAARVLANLDGILRAAGSDRSRVVKVTVYLTDVGRFAEFNKIYATFFGNHRPARAVVGVTSLPRGAEVEIEALAAR
jgi:2-iminobutanoate/2-iminopropanoate deaminase